MVGNLALGIMKVGRGDKDNEGASEGEGTHPLAPWKTIINKNRTGQ